MEYPSKTDQGKAMIKQEVYSMKNHQLQGWSVPLFVLALSVLQLSYAQGRRYKIPPISVEAQRQAIDVGGHELFVLKAGQGNPVVVLIHGFASTHRTFNTLVNGLSKDHTVISYDRAGYGKSTLNEAAADGQSQAAALAVVLDSLHFNRCVLVGHSFGCHIARLFAHSFPERTDGIVLLDPAHENTRHAMGEILTGDDLALFKQMDGAMPPMQGGAGADQAQRERTFAALRRMAVLPPMPSVVISAGKRPVPREFSEAAQARLIDNDWAMQEDLARRVCGGALIRLENAGHQVHLDAPEAVMAALESVLERVVAESGR